MNAEKEIKVPVKIPSVDSQVEAIETIFGLIFFIDKENKMYKYAIEKSKYKNKKLEIQELAKYPLSEDIILPTTISFDSF